MDRAVRGMMGICTAVLVCGAARFAYPILAPVAFALFTIAIVWPLHKRLQSVLPSLLALAVTVLVTVSIVAGLLALAVWGFGQVSQWLIQNAARLQAVYFRAAHVLEEHGLASAAVADQLDIGWLIAVGRRVAGSVQSAIRFALLTLVFMILGLLEVDVTARKLRRLAHGEAGSTALAVASQTASKLQKYMLVRSVVSATTGLVVWAFAATAGLELAPEWGVIAFVLNYIPFIGPLVATALPALPAIAQFESWQMALLVFMCLNLIQFLSGSYIEPRIAGATLSISPFMVLFAVFFWSFLWGIPGRSSACRS